ncbi:hypothetical protein GCM10007079_35300 [Nocardiopsis terrae]|uniref:Thioesterase DpgC n=1 Tax=Nocardiopsis terrae TaxID=372655 RepID=A0ABR9HD16_9ACTN|nr:enoyl-CoA hydratase/isomerase family protein [Nocardiopsis terrae]MBE1456927.1 thioesterase DpgC [Nocardiopsis terrae]GHC89655.1 hypothetical protein GCM10007079_35300 [Nocardiopsis terrae]
MRLDIPADGPGTPMSGIDAPALTGDLTADRLSAADYLEAVTAYVDALPARPDRSADERRAAEHAHGRARRVRRDFLNTHVEGLYTELTDGLTRAPRFEELSETAAEAVPGLVPGPKRLAEEAARCQADKEGWEIDQGLFFAAVLARARTGDHLLRSMLAPTPRALSLLGEFRRRGHVDLGVATLTNRGGVGHLELANHDCLNAEDDAAVEALETGTDLVLLDDSVRVGVLRGAPMNHTRYRGRRVFSAGVNLTHLYEGGISLAGFMLRREAGYIAKIMRGLHRNQAGPAALWSGDDKPWVGAVDAFAIGGGMQILLALDGVVAEEGVYAALPAMEEGLIPGLANLRLPRLVGARAARRIIFTGEQIHASAPEAPLVFDEVVPTRGMDSAVERAATRLAEPAVPANRRALGAGEEPPDLFRRYLARYALDQAFRMYSDDLIANLERTWIRRGTGRE